MSKGEPRRGWSLAAIAGLALAWRVVYVLVWRHDPLVFGDGLAFHLQAIDLADGLGFTDPIKYHFLAGLHPSAAHPPLFSLVLFAVTRTGRALGLGSFDTTLVHQLTCAAISSIAVVVIGLIGHMLGGARAGLIAAGLAAAYPPLWVSDALVMSESLFVLTIALALLAYYRFHEHPSWRTAAACGVAIGAAALTRPEAAFLVPLLGIPFVVGRSDRSRRSNQSRWRRGGAIALVAIVAATVCAPWVVRNLVTFHRPVLLSENVDSVIAGANCEPTYYGHKIGSWDVTCHTLPVPVGDESDMGAVLRHRGQEYARQHLGRLPLVAAARLGRTFLVFKPLANKTDAGRPAWTQWATVILYFPVQVLAVVGVVVLRRRRIRAWPLVAMAALVAGTSVFTYGISRFRVPWDVASVIAAAVGIECLLASRSPTASPARTS